MECGFGPSSGCACVYHVWMRSRGRTGTQPPVSALTGLCKVLRMPFSARQNYLDGIDPCKVKTSEERPKKFRCVDDVWMRQKQKTTLMRREIKIGSVPVGMKRLVLFIKILDYCGKAPWANIQFSVNEAMLQRLIASHLVLIVGKKNWEVEKASLYPIITSDEDLSTTQNVVRRCICCLYALAISVHWSKYLCVGMGDKSTARQDVDFGAIFSGVECAVSGWRKFDVCVFDESGSGARVDTCSEKIYLLVVIRRTMQGIFEWTRNETTRVNTRQ